MALHWSILDGSNAAPNPMRQSAWSHVTSRRRFLAQLACSLVALPSVRPSALAKPNASALLAQDFAPGIDVSRYLISEKFDGVRALWDGSALRFRSGRTIAAPAWFIAKLPNTLLDGELWLGRGQFDVLSGLVRKVAPSDEAWQRVSYLVFELPGGQGTFAERVQRLRSVVEAAAWSQLKAVEHFSLPNEAALRAKLTQIVQAGGEGLMLHRADAPYLTGRNAALLKLKPMHDAEARVVGHIAGKGKYVGMLGALRVETPEGKRVTLGTGFSDAQRQQPPAIGSVVT